MARNKYDYHVRLLASTAVIIAMLCAAMPLAGAASNNDVATLKNGGTADVCSLYGTTNYTNTWLGVNFLVLLVSILVISIVFSLGSVMGADMRAKIRSIVRFELIQVIISVFIIGAILGFSVVACSVSAQFSTSTTGTTMSPLQYADYYIGTVSLSKGLDLLTQAYAEGVKYAIDASVVNNLQYVFGSFFKGEQGASPNNFGNINIPSSTKSAIGLGPTPPTSQSGGIEAISTSNVKKFISVSPTSGEGFGLYNVYSSLSGQYFGLFSPLIIFTLGLLMIQFLIIPVVQYTAFLVVLPVAIGMRSIAFTSSTLGDASNSLIALAIAFYIVYPMTVAFNAYAAGWIFSNGNPSYQFLNSAFSTSLVSSTSPFQYFNQPQTSQSKQTDMFSTMTQTLLPFFTQSASSNFNIPVIGDLSLLHYYIDQLAEFMFSSMLMFVIDIGITSMFAVSLYKALQSGLGEQTRFW